MTPNGLSRRRFLRKSGNVAAALAAAQVLSQNAGVATARAAAASGNEICRMDAVSLADKIRSKQLSAVEVTEAVLARMEKLEPTCMPSARPRRRLHARPQSASRPT